MSERLINNKLKNTHKDVLKFSCATNIDKSSVVHMESNGFYEKLGVQLHGSDVWKKNNQFHVKKNGGSQGHHDDIANGDENEHNYYIVSLIIFMDYIYILMVINSIFLFIFIFDMSIILKYYIF